MTNKSNNEQSLDPELDRFRIGRRVKEIRKKRGLTQKQLAEQMGFPHSMIATIERGRYNFKIETLSAVARALGCTIDFAEDK